MAKHKKRAAPGSIEYKLVTFDTKSVADQADEDGYVYVEAYASVFDNVDSHNDIIQKGAYADSLAKWAEKGAPIPSFYNHGIFSSDPHDNIGFLQVAQEDSKGLKVRAALDVAHNAKAAYVHRLIKSGRLREMSVGYIAKAWELVHEEGKREWEYSRKLTQVDLLEASFVTVASNPLATVTSKAAALLYGGDDEAEGGEGGEGDEEEKAGNGVDADAVDAVRAALATAREALDAAEAALAADDEGDEDESEDGDEPDDEKDDSGKNAGAKSLSARARVALAMIALQGAGTE